MADAAPTTPAAPLPLHPFDILLQLDQRIRARIPVAAVSAQLSEIRGRLAVRLSSWNLLFSMDDVAEIVPLPRITRVPGVKRWLLGIAFGVMSISILSLLVYYTMGWIRPVFGASANYVIFALLCVAYVALLKVASREDPLQIDDPNAEITQLPLPGPTVRSGLYFLLPVVVLIWALMVDRLSPGLSAFWATAFMIFILLTQRPLMLMMRGEDQSGNKTMGAAFRAGVNDLVDGMIAGARNMIGIGIATATAGIIVGAVSQTGVGSALADVVEVMAAQISSITGGYVSELLAILFLTAILSLILGMGLPTTANYLVVSALRAPVIVISVRVVSSALTTRRPSARSMRTASASSWRARSSPGGPTPGAPRATTPRYASAST